MPSPDGSRADITLGSGRPDALIADLLGRDFEVQRVTKPLAKQIDEAQAAVDDAVSSDDLVAAVGTLLDLYLKPAGNSRTKASKLLLDGWESGDIDIGQITGYHQNVQQVALAPPPLTR